MTWRGLAGREPRQNAAGYSFSACVKNPDLSPDTSDDAIFARVVAGDTEAFGPIVARYKDRLYSFVLYSVGDKETAEDIVQETFLRCLHYKTHYRAVATFSTWLFTIAANLATSEIRRRARWHFFFLDQERDDDRHFELPDTAQLPNDALDRTMIQEQVQRALSALSPTYRQPLILRDIEGMSYEEIAGILSVPVGTVKSRINRGRLKLQKKLRGFWREITTQGSL